MAESIKVVLFAMIAIKALAETPSLDKAASIAAFNDVYKVLMHPRCRNCHPSGDAPLQGDTGTPHAFNVKRGADGSGDLIKCGACHQANNLDAPHLPPGAPHPASAKKAEGEPRWRLPAAKMPLVFEGRTPRQLCLQLLNKKTNGNLDHEKLMEHAKEDTFITWGWNPGEGRPPAPGSHAEFVARFSDWLSKGAACPE